VSNHAISSRRRSASRADAARITSGPRARASRASASASDEPAALSADRVTGSVAPSGDGDRDLADPRAPLGRPGLVNRIAPRIDRDRHRHVLHFEFADGFHAEVGEGENARGANRLRYEIRRAADRDAIDRAVLPDRLDRDRAAFALAHHADEAGLREYGL